MCKFYKFYICPVVGVIIEWLDNMHGVTIKNKCLNLYDISYILTNFSPSQIDVTLKFKYLILLLKFFSCDS